MSKRAVRIANRASADLSPHDARAILASLAARSIEGGEAAMIRPDVRRRLVARAASMGLRPFDANLVIAIVQDDARVSGGTTGRGVEPGAVEGADARPRVHAAQLSADAIDRLRFVRPAPSADTNHAIALRLLIALLAGAVGAYALARWLLLA
jgi:hypothetical protein